MGSSLNSKKSTIRLKAQSCNGDTFQIFLDEFAKINPKEYKIIVLDNRAFHKAKRLKIPHNITLLFLPPYAPELNSAEKIWHHIKRKFINKYFNTFDEISDFFSHTIQSITSDMVKSIGSYSYLSLNSFRSD
ncbi:MAG: transposase [Prevotellaceae bacterium]|jgi:transposase|nr:transposase [Prevotellaceae bacterium]